MYLNNGGSNWVINNKWLGSEDHCTWYGVVECSISSSVTKLALEANGLSGPFPLDLSNLKDLDQLNLSSNSLTGAIPNDVCLKSTSNSLYIYGDAANCPNIVNASHVPGCCDDIQFGS